MLKFYYNICIIETDKELNENILYAYSGFLVIETEPLLKSRLRSIVDDALDTINDNYNISKNTIIESSLASEYYCADEESYNMIFDIINIDYDKSVDIIKSDKYYIVTDMYKVYPLLNGDIILNRFVIFNDEEEMQLEFTDYDDKSGTLFNIGDKVKLIKDPYNENYIIIGRAGHNRGIQQSNSYCVRNIKTGDELDCIHESDIVLS